MSLYIQVEQCFALSASSFTMSYQDDDGETTDILNEHDLTEAIQYFYAGADDNASTNGSILSGYSGRISRKITLRIKVAVEYDGPSLSDTGSLVSLEDYQRPGHDSIHLSDTSSYNSHVFPLEDPDDDAVTISSHDTSSRQAFPSGRYNQRDFANRFSESLSIEEEDAVDIYLSESNLSFPEGSATNSRPTLENNGSTPPTSGEDSIKPSPITVTEAPEAAPGQVFERLRQLDSDPFAISQQSLPLDANERGVKWLRDQTDRAAWHTIATPTPSSNTLRALAEQRYPVAQVASTESDFDAASSSMGGDLELQKDDKGKYYFAFTSDSSSHGDGEREHPYSRSRDSISISEDPPAPQEEVHVMETATYGAGPSSGAGLAKRVSQVSHITESGESSSSAGLRQRPGYVGGRLGRVVESGEISPELLQAILESESQSGPEMVTDCSSCGDILESFRYVCTTCGEKTPQSRDSLAFARSAAAEFAPSDPFADPQDSASDRGLRLYSQSESSGSALPLVPPRDEEDIVDARSESSFGTSSWVDSRDHSQPRARAVVEEPSQSGSGWQAMFKAGTVDPRAQHEFPLSTFKLKLKKGLKRGLGVPPSLSNGKGKSLPPLPSEHPSSNSPSSSSNPPYPHPQTSLPGTYVPREQHQHSHHEHLHHPRRPEVIIAGRVSQRSNSSSGSRSNSNSASTLTVVESGYELCSKCIENAGVAHAEEVLNTVTSPTPTQPGPSHSMSSSSLGSSPHEAMQQHSPSNTMYTSPASAMGGQSEWTAVNGASITGPPVPKKPKRKAQIRHAYLEKFWGVGGWQDVGACGRFTIIYRLLVNNPACGIELDDEVTCSICNKELDRERYKCEYLVFRRDDLLRAPVSVCLYSSAYHTRYLMCPIQSLSSSL